LSQFLGGPGRRPRRRAVQVTFSVKTLASPAGPGGRRAASRPARSLEFVVIFPERARYLVGHRPNQVGSDAAIAGLDESLDRHAGHQLQRPELRSSSSELQEFVRNADQREDRLLDAETDAKRDQAFNEGRVLHVRRAAGLARVSGRAATAPGRPKERRRPVL
jgi:hypothetical protein